MKSEELIKKINEINKDYYTVSDIEKITAQPRRSVLVMLNRLVKAEKLARLQKNYYVPTDKNINYELIAQQIVPQSYISFESALSHHGILSQIPYILTLATDKRPKSINLGGREVIYKKLKKGLYGDYVMVDKIRIASPEKALLDTLYLLSRGKVKLNLDELDLKIINIKRLIKISKKFPEYVQDMLKADAEKGVVKILK